MTSSRVPGEDDLATGLDHDAVATAVDGTAPASPSGRVRDRLLASLDEVNRFGWYVRDVAELLGIPDARADQVLRLVDEPDGWEAGPMGLVRIRHLPKDAAVAGAATGFIRHEAGDAFPEHRHLGTELSYVLQGGLAMDDGRVFRPGQLLRMEAGESHSFRALPGAPLIYLLVLREGIEVGGHVLRADDPSL